MLFEEEQGAEMIAEWDTSLAHVFVSVCVFSIQFPSPSGCSGFALESMGSAGAIEGVHPGFLTTTALITRSMTQTLFSPGSSIAFLFIGISFVGLFYFHTLHLCLMSKKRISINYLVPQTTAVRLNHYFDFTTICRA